MILTGVLTAAGCVGSPPVESLPTQESDLELYASLAELGAMLRVEDGCNGRSTEAVTNSFIKKYYHREMVLRAELESEHGRVALEGLEYVDVHPRCGDGRSRYWRTRYETVLTELERRLKRAARP